MVHVCVILIDFVKLPSMKVLLMYIPTQVSGKGGQDGASQLPPWELEVGHYTYFCLAFLSANTEEEGHRKAFGTPCSGAAVKITVSILFRSEELIHDHVR